MQYSNISWDPADCLPGADPCMSGPGVRAHPLTKSSGWS